jgi:hypothetical protein
MKMIALVMFSFLSISKTQKKNPQPEPGVSYISP